MKKCSISNVAHGSKTDRCKCKLFYQQMLVLGMLGTEDFHRKLYNNNCVSFYTNKN